MPRFKNVNGQKVPFTAQEEAARDAEEQNFNDNIKPIRQVKQVYKEAIDSAEQSAPFDADEKLVLLALYAEVKTFRAAVLAGATASALDAPLIDAVNTVFPGQSRVQIANTIEARAQSYLETAAVALANKIKDS